MKKQCTILIIGLFVASVFSGMLWAERQPDNGVVRGIFVRPAAREVSEREYLAIVIEPFESDDHVTLLVPRRQEELGLLARRLREGQKVEITYVVEDRQKWVKRIEAERPREPDERLELQRRPEGERRPERKWRPDIPWHPESEEHLKGFQEIREGRRRWAHLQHMQRELQEVLAAHLERMANEFKELLMHVERMDKELQELRAENERLRRELHERGWFRKERGREVRERRDAEGRRETRERREREPERERKERQETRERREREPERERKERQETKEREERRE